MQSGASSPAANPAPTQERDSSPRRSNKRQRILSERDSEEESIDGSTTSRSRTMLTTQAPTHRGSSRDANDLTEMHRSSTPPEASGSGNVKYTRTGRVSKATKGQRVHYCDECGKTYTRAEHLRRHQQNHKPGAFACDIPGCGRSFFREDLLIRHKFRHNDPNDPPSRRQSVTSVPDAGGIVTPEPYGVARPQPAFVSAATTVAPDLHPDTPDNKSQHSDLTSRYQLFKLSPPKPVQSIQSVGGLTLPPKRVPVPHHELPVAIGIDGPLIPQPQNPWQSSRAQSPMYDYESSDEAPAYGGPYLQPQRARARNMTTPTFLGYERSQRTSRSPISASSSIIFAPQQPYFTVHDGTYNNGAVLASAFVDQGVMPVPDSSQIVDAEARDFMEQNELAVLPSGLLDNSFDDSGDEASLNVQQYLDAFYTEVHDLFPVIHKPTFELASASPLLRSAILALGGQAVGGRADLLNARALHERGVKVLKKRTMRGSHTYRVCDMQAIVLVEAYSIFKSRRPPLQLSQSFDRVYRVISNDPQALYSTPYASQTNTSTFDDDIGAILERRVKQRILLACYTLEQQHALLFGRPTMDCYTGLALDLPFPCPQIEWEADVNYLYENPEPAPGFDRLCEALRPVPYLEAPLALPHDIFTSTVMLACLCDPTSDLHSPITYSEDTDNSAPMLFAVEQSPRARLTYHTSMLCKNTPIRALLAVAGESWVMAEKMSTQAEYTEAQFAIREWAKGRAVPSRQSGRNHETMLVDRALAHAFSIMAIQQHIHRTGLLFHEWSLYLAALVVWASTYVQNVEGCQSRLSIPNPTTEPRLTPTELEVAVTTLLHSGATASIGWMEALYVLMWSKAKIERVDVPHQNGVVSGILDVLSKLVIGGNEQGRWF